METVVVKDTRLRSALLLTASMGLAAGGGLMAAAARSSAESLIGWGAAAFFGAGVPLFAWQLLDARPRLILDERGIFDRTNGMGWVPWSEIA